MRKITVPSSVIALRSDKTLTPAMVSTVWEVAAAMDEQRVAATVSNAIWLKIPTIRLRGEGSRADNVWLRECLDRLTGIKLSGEYRGDPWGAVLLAEWRITQGGSMAELLIPPAGVHALRSPTNFAKIEAVAAHRLTGHGQRLYSILADKKRLGRPYWIFSLDELRALMDADGKSSYDRWNNFRQWVLEPALEAIKAYGTVNVKMTPQKEGRSVCAVRFDWEWKDLHDAADMAATSEQEPEIYAPAETPAAIEEASQPDPALEWWASLTVDQREKWSDVVGRTLKHGGYEIQRREADIARSAFVAHEAGRASSEVSYQDNDLTH